MDDYELQGSPASGGGPFSSGSSSGALALPVKNMEESVTNYVNDRPLEDSLASGGGPFSSGSGALALPVRDIKEYSPEYKNVTVAVIITMAVLLPFCCVFWLCYAQYLNSLGRKRITGRCCGKCKHKTEKCTMTQDVVERL